MELKSSEEEGEYKASFDETGNVVLKKKSKIRKGKKSRASGAQFELKVRRDLEEKGWIVDKWSNNVDLEEQKVVQAKRKFNPFKRVMTIGTGFPDFIAFQQTSANNYNIIGVEVKSNGILSKEEKQKCATLLNKRIFNNILLAKKGEKRGRTIPIEYVDFREKWKNFLKNYGIPNPPHQ